MYVRTVRTVIVPRVTAVAGAGPDEVEAVKDALRARGWREREIAT